MRGHPDPDPVPDTAAAHPALALQDTVHQRVRLGLLAVLTEARRADFVYLRETLALTDGNLARHLGVLEQAGYVALEKTFENRKPRTWVTITRQGRQAFAAELSALRDLLARIGP
jgi:DNA-binding MarR family transcriptional regulator